MRNEQISPLPSHVEQLLNGFDFLEVPGRWLFQFVPFSVDCAFGIRNIYRIFDGDGHMHHTVMEIGHISLLLRRCGPSAFVVFPPSLRIC